MASDISLDDAPWPTLPDELRRYQATRTESLPKAVLAACPVNLLRPQGRILEGEGGTYFDSDRGLTLLCSVWIRPLFYVLNDGRRVALLFGIADPTAGPSDVPAWELAAIDIESLTNAQSFESLLLSKWATVWFGSRTELKHLIQGAVSTVQVPLQRNYGRSEGISGGLVFSNGVLLDGEFVGVDRDGLILHRDKPVFFELNEDTPPQLRPTYDVDAKPRGKACVRQLVQAIYEAFGPPGVIGVAHGAMAWCRKTVLASLGGFPFPFFVGARSTGKSTLMRAILEFYGYPGEPLQGAEVTPAALNRYFDQSRGLPLCLDDARPEVLAKIEGHLLGAFTGASATRASRNSVRGMVSYQSGAALILGSEAMPQDPAVRSRCLILRLEPGKTDQGPIDLVRKLARPAGASFLQICSASAGTLERRFLECALLLTTELDMPEVRDRTQVWNVGLAAVQVFLQLADFAPAQRNKMLKDCTEYAEKTAVEFGAVDWVAEFFADLVTMLESGHEKISEVAKYAPAEQQIHMSLRGLFAHWVRFRRQQGRPAFYSETDLRRDLKSKPWHCPHKKQRKIRRGSRTLNAVSVRVDETVPPAIRELAELLTEPTYAAGPESDIELE